MENDISFDQKTLNTFWKKVEETENIPTNLISSLKTIINNEEINSNQIINLIKENIGNQDA